MCMVSRDDLIVEFNHIVVLHFSLVVKPANINLDIFLKMTEKGLDNSKEEANAQSHTSIVIILRPVAPRLYCRRIWYSTGLTTLNPAGCPSSDLWMDILLIQFWEFRDTDLYLGETKRYLKQIEVDKETRTQRREQWQLINAKNQTKIKIKIIQEQYHLF